MATTEEATYYRHDERSDEPFEGLPDGRYITFDFRCRNHLSKLVLTQGELHLLQYGVPVAVHPDVALLLVKLCPICMEELL